METAPVQHPDRRQYQRPRYWDQISGMAGGLLASGRRHRALISPLLDGLCVVFIALLYISGQTTLYLHLVYVTLSVGAFIRGGAWPTLSRSTGYTAVMLVYMFHIQATDDFLEIPMMWVISILAAGLAQVNENSSQEHQRIAAADHLTGLANRREFDRRLGSAAAASFAVLAVDVDELKLTNDAFGHEAGDAVLCAVARGMRSAVRQGDVVARTGGDEFAAILLGAGAVTAAEIGERVRRAVAAETVAKGTVSVSVGWAVAERPNVASEVILQADAALYRAKAAGRNCVAGPLALAIAV